jgi:hypothetical protein
MTQSSSAELHLTAVNWLTGLAPTAAGASVLLLLDAKTPPSLRVGLAALVGLLLLGFVFGTMVQLHTIRSVGFREAGNSAAADLAASNRNTFQKLMLASLYGAVLLVIMGAFHAARTAAPREPPAESWKVLSTSGGPGAQTIVLGDAAESRVLLLKHGAGDSWVTTTFSKQETEK